MELSASCWLRFILVTKTVFDRCLYDSQLLQQKLLLKDKHKPFAQTSNFNIINPLRNDITTTLSHNPLISSVIFSIPFSHPSLFLCLWHGMVKSVFQASNWTLAPFSSTSVWTCVSQGPVFNFSGALMMMNDGSRHSGVFNIPIWFSPLQDFP